MNEFWLCCDMWTHNSPFCDTGIRNIDFEVPYFFMENVLFSILMYDVSNLRNQDLPIPDLHYSKYQICCICWILYKYYGLEHYINKVNINHLPFNLGKQFVGIKACIRICGRLKSKCLYLKSANNFSIYRMRSLDLQCYRTVL